MKNWIIAVVTLSMLSLGAPTAIAEDTDKELFVGVDGEGNVHYATVEEMASSEYTRSGGTCTFDLVENACSTGEYDPPIGVTHGFSFPTGTVMGDFQSNLIGANGDTHQWSCTITFIDGVPAPGTTGFACKSSEGSDWPLDTEFTHECYAYPTSTIGLIPGSADPADPGSGAPGWIDQPESSTQCQVSAIHS